MTDTKSPYPVLLSMGVESPKQIDNYYLTSINRVDVLRIVYERPKGSFLPSSRTYKFPRVTDAAANVVKDTQTPVLKTHPRLAEALDELQKLLDAKSSKETIAAQILDEIALLEEDIAMRSECLRVLVAKIPKAG